MLDIPGYRVLGTIRATGSNALFHAMRDADGLPVIIKTPMAPSPGPRECERYQREFAILQRLRDVKGVARPYACERLQERPVLLLERVQGEALSESAGKPLELGRFLSLAISLATTLGEVHDRNVIHKDIKPSNIILEPNGEGKLIDFGAATVQKVEHVDAAPTHLIEGTLAYMSPEQTGRMNRTVDYRTDFYSLGVTLYELLTGQRPFRGGDALEWFHAHMAQNPKPPNELRPEVPPALSAIVMKLLAKTAEDRYQSAEGLTADLQRCREERSHGAPSQFAPGEHDTPHHFQLPQRLYGREAQVATLLQGFERVGQTGRSELFLVSGYSGIGKSSVVHELHKPVVQRRSFFLSGKFDQFQRDVPYATIAQALRGLVQQLLAGTDAEIARWREKVNAAWEGQGQVLVELVPQLKVVVGKQPPLPHLSTLEAQHRFRRVVCQFLTVFASTEHPLVVFLDDLQWADLSSLRLIGQLLSQPDTPPVLWIGAYRDTEVSPEHPLTPVLEEVRKAGVPVQDLRLEPLSLKQVEALVADTLPGAGAELVGPLSALVHEKTAGNPFFLLQFLVALHQDGLLVRASAGGWRWSAEEVKARGYSDNVVDFMVGKLRQLPSGTQHLLKLAACVGNIVPLPLLGTLADIPEVLEVEHGLEPALQEGLLMRSSPEQYRFLHDRIQQAAHALSSEHEGKALHLRIGRLLLGSLSPGQLRDRLFDVVSQFHAGGELIEEPEERHRVARLNAEAGIKAQAAVAHRPAIAYFTAAFGLIPGDPWQTDYELAFQVTVARARCELACGNTTGALELAKELRTQARGRADMTAAWSLESDCFLTMGDIRASVASMLECVAQLGMPVSEHPTWEEASAAHEEVWKLLADRPIESLIELPRMSDLDMQVMMGALVGLFPKASVTDKHLLIIVTSRMVALSLRHGFTSGAVVGLAWFGQVTSSVFKRHREGQALVTLARALVERYELAAYRGTVSMAMWVLSSWIAPLPTVREIGLASFQQALQSGEFFIATHLAGSLVGNRLVAGHDLEEVYQESVARSEFVRKVGVRDAVDVLQLRQAFIRNLRGQSRAFGDLSGEGFEEQAFEAQMTSARSPGTRSTYWLLKLESRVLSGAWREAVGASEKAAELAWLVHSVEARDFYLYRALVLAASFEESSPEEQARLVRELHRLHQWLAEWAEHSPSSFRAAERMVAGELARLEGRWEEASRAYEEAIRAGRENGSSHFVGLASELAANFWQARRSPMVAHTFAREARAAFLQWGALGKVQHLDSLWPGLAPAESKAETQTSSTDSTRIDALTVVKAQQAISGEILLERLGNTLVRVAIENAGAQRGVLLLPSGDTLSVVATSSELPETGENLPDPSAARELPWMILSYVKRTQEPVLIGDATQPHPFLGDEYLARSKARSVLCLPLMRQEQLTGVLYLENNLVTHAFNPARLTLLGHLASQAAISIENARLYADVQRARQQLRQANDDLEQRVEERTRELSQAQARLVDTARAVGMAEVASNVLHNVGNVLTSAVINLEMMQRAVGGSRVGKLKQATSLLLEHHHELSSFLAPAARGGHLPEYLSRLSDELMSEQMRLLEDMDAMGRHIEHIRAIVQVQQTYAKSSLMTEECDLRELIEDALRIQLPALQRHGVTVVRELAALPRLKVDKHKVLQILINLISNAKHALDAVPEGDRHLTLRLEAEGERVRIQVEDNGMGISEENQKKLFSHGFTTRKEGHGFGLHASALAAQMLGGRLTLESEGPGKGAVATLELPRS